MGPLQEQINTENDACDRCGYTKDDQAISQGMYRIRTPKGVLWLCGHHCHEHWGHIVAEGYEVTLVLCQRQMSTSNSGGADLCTDPITAPTSAGQCAAR